MKRRTWSQSLPLLNEDSTEECGVLVVEVSGGRVCFIVWLESRVELTTTRSYSRVNAQDVPGSDPLIISDTERDEVARMKEG